MDENTELLICLGASTAANCVPCFEHYFRKAAAIGLTPEEIQRAVELASKVKNGAHVMMRGSIRNIMGHDSGADDAACPSSGSTCCG